MEVGGGAGAGSVLGSSATVDGVGDDTEAEAVLRACDVVVVEALGLGRCGGVIAGAEQIDEEEDRETTIVAEGMSKAGSARSGVVVVVDDRVAVLFTPGLLKGERGHFSQAVQGG
ncbi:hypothetical protein VNO80_16060 [Phaseolus coccineus]|uniref:Uncharacterized protein n=1 Tax=Phaseolus coccineus TaxID=3886 RepID=A0AAN9MQ25_PHACN